MRCWYCKRKGHSAKECPYKKKGSRGKGRGRGRFRGGGGRGVGGRGVGGRRGGGNGGGGKMVVNMGGATFSVFS